jgi:putative peptide zinc metalloprotease protein
MSVAGDTVLPELREDIRIVRRDVGVFGVPAWILLDPVRNKFFSVGFELFQLLSLWNANRRVDRLVASVADRFGRAPAPEEIDNALVLLDSCQLLAAPLAGGWSNLHRRATGPSWLSSIIHGYLFFRIPLARPELAIRALWPYISFLASRGVLIATAIIGLLGLYLVSRQWDAFINTFSYLFSVDGLVASFVALAIVKSIHECGHAIVAHRFGCRVPSAGLAFVVMVPRLYTDVSDVWRLSSRRSRVLVDAAGVIAELYVAAYALLLWVFIPDGPVRSAVFVLATTSWVMSLFLNLSPFTRFDGYYILSDLVGIENLQARAFAHFRWRLRRVLFALDEPPPEVVPAGMSRFLLVYAIATMVYRLVLYLGIAVLVYHFFIKAVGIILFCIEMAYFTLLPIWSEVRIWWQERATLLRRRRTYITLAIFGLGLLAVCTPFSSQISAPALLMPQQYTHLHASEAGHLVWVAQPDDSPLSRGSALATIDSPELERDIRLAALQLDLAEKKLARIGARDSLRTERVITESERRKFGSELVGLQERKEQLTIRLPFDAQRIVMDPEMQSGRWVGQGEEIAYAISGSAGVARGYVGEDDAGRLRAGAQGTFIPADISSAAISVTIASIATTAVDRIDIEQLASVRGGPIAAAVDAKSEVISTRAQRVITAIPDDTSIGYEQEIPGSLLLRGAPESILSRVLRQMISVLVRELSA